MPELNKPKSGAQGHVGQVDAGATASSQTYNVSFLGSPLNFVAITSSIAEYFKFELVHQFRMQIPGERGWDGAWMRNSQQCCWSEDRSLSSKASIQKKGKSSNVTAA